jgi:hypothetical protein
MPQPSSTVACRLPAGPASRIFRSLVVLPLPVLLGPGWLDFE